jgi:hypothetical protein
MSKCFQPKGVNSSNLETIIDKGLKIAENLSGVWASGTFDDKLKLQTLEFPEGIVYSKKWDTVRTLRLNSLFAPFPDLVSVLEDKENGHFAKSGLNSHQVAPAGIDFLFYLQKDHSTWEGLTSEQT